MDPERAPERSAVERLLALPRAKREALDALLQRGKNGVTRAPRTADAGRGLPTSYGQQRLWFLDQWQRGSAAYNIPAAVPLESPVDVPAVRQALTEIVRRHSVLRTVFRTTATGPVQDVCPAADATLSVVPVPGACEADVRRELERLATLEAQRPFDLAAGPLFRSVLFTPESGDALLLMTMHHIVADGWSLGILFHELKALYGGRRTGLPAALPSLPVQYSDYAVWQQNELTRESLASQLAYWRTKLAGAPALRLPTDRRPSSSPTLEGAQYPILAPARVRDDLFRLNRSEGVTMNMTLLAAFQVLLHRYSGQDDIIVGLPVAGRHLAGTERLIGFFVNFLVMRTDVGGATTFREYLHRVRQTTLEGFDNQDVPFEWVVSTLHPDRERGRNPLFQVTFQLFAGAQSANEVNRPLAGSIDIDKGTALFDLAFNLWETTRGIEGRIEYSTDLFDRETIARMADHFVALLEAVAADADRSIDDLPLLTAADRARILTEWNATDAVAPDERPVHVLVEEHAARHPGRPAVRAADGEVRYGELNAAANRVAHMLIADHQVGPGTSVAICLERSAAFITALLGVVKAGAAYVPIDPSYPRERIGFLVRDAGAAVAISDRSLLRLDAVDVPVRSVDDASDRPPHDPGVRVRPQDLAYIVYTSGSTGVPKGVEIEHRALRNLVEWHLQAYDVVPDDRATQIASVSFDAAVWEMWPHLAAGASISIPDDDTRRHPERLLQWLADEAITICFLPTPLAEAMLRLSLPRSLTLRHLLTGGDRLRFRPERPMPFRLTNHYGPTENTVVATAGVVEPRATRDVPDIGRPIRNTRVFILDARGRPVPEGIAGEIHLAGTSLARGYRGRPDLTADRFVPNPFGADGEQMYRLGDLARWRTDGSIEFLGRGDRQLKIRGVRIEPGEIESTLGRHPAVRDAVVCGRPGPDGEPRLVAYVVLRAGQPPGSDAMLREFLAAQLPDPLVPSAFVALDALPITAHGKIDVDALPPPEVPGAPAEDEHPATDVEKRLASIWQQVVHAEHVGVHDDFFTDHGGHSLLTVALVSRIRDVFQVDLPLRAVFEAPTIRRLAARIFEAPAITAGGRRAIPRRRDRDRAPCSFAQQRLWFLDRLMPGHGSYNIPVAIRLDTHVDAVVLQYSVDVLVERHEALRTTLQAVDGEPQQHVASRIRIDVAFDDLRHLPADRREAEAMRLATLEARRPFVLDGGALLRVGLLRLDDRDHVLLVTTHHIVADGWSIEILFRELTSVYDALAKSEPVRLVPLPIGYGDYAEWQRGLVRDGALNALLEYWRERLAGMPALELPVDRPRLAIATYQGGREFVTIGADVTSRLVDLSQRVGTTVFMTLLAGFQTLIYRYSGQTDVSIGTLTAGRDRVETEGLIGLFVNTLVLRTDLGGSPSFHELLGRVKETALGAYANSEVPFEKLVEELQPERDLSRNPLVQVTFQFLTGSGNAVKADGSRTLDVDRRVSTFDLSLDMWETGGCLKGRIEYSTDLFDPQTIVRLAGHFQTLLESAVSNPDASIDRLALLDVTEMQCQAVEWNRTARDYPRHETLHGLFQAQACRTPDAIAVVEDGRSVTYAQLARRAGDIADRLAAAGVQPGSIVGIYLVRSIDWIATALGVLDAGAAYLPLDPSQPPRRIESVVADADVRYVVAAGALPLGSSGLTVIDVNASGSSGGWARVPTSTSIDPRALAYVLYTSGSTGRPRGVMVEHRSLVNHAFAIRDRDALVETDRVLQFAPPGFDVAAEEIFPTLAAGAAVVLRPDEPLIPHRVLAAYLTTTGVTVANLPSAYWHGWVDALDDVPLPSTLRLMIVGSERVDPQRVSRWREKFGGHPRLLNAYGTTETTITALTADLSADGWQAGQEVSVGRPLANVTAHILDAHLQPLPIGVTGDLHIGGDGIARGYLHDEPAAFAPSPFGEGRLYRTGDRARRLPDGQIVLCGRADRQIKIRGFRIEPGEIEAVLKQHPSVRDAVVLQPPMEPLAAYVVAPGAASADLDRFLRDRLPDYMVPSFIVLMERFPTTARGKLDRGALPSPGSAVRPRGIATESSVERIISGIWEEALRIERPRADENFFELGGHSLLLLRVHSRLEAAFAREIAVVDLFRYPTIRLLAEFLGERRSGIALAHTTDGSVHG